jgi:hypothetical protein
MEIGRGRSGSGFSRLAPASPAGDGMASVEGDDTLENDGAEV